MWPSNSLLEIHWKVELLSIIFLILEFDLLDVFDVFGLFNEYWISLLDVLFFLRLSIESEVLRQKWWFSCIGAGVGNHAALRGCLPDAWEPNGSTNGGVPRIFFLPWFLTHVSSNLATLSTNYSDTLLLVLMLVSYQYSSFMLPSIDRKKNSLITTVLTAD